VNGPFEVIGTRIVPIPARHGDIGVLGFRFGSAAYLTDFSVLPETSNFCSRGSMTWCWTRCATCRTPMHQTVEQALELVRELQPRRAWFTHIAPRIAAFGNQ